MISFPHNNLHIPIDEYMMAFMLSCYIRDGYLPHYRIYQDRISSPAQPQAWYLLEPQ